MHPLVIPPLLWGHHEERQRLCCLPIGCPVPHSLFSAHLWWATVESLRRKSFKREAFVSVDDMKTPSTAEIALPVGSRHQRTGWASEASAEKKAQIAEVLAATTIPEGDVESDPSSTTRGPMNSLRTMKGIKGKVSRDKSNTGMSLKVTPMRNKKAQKLFGRKKRR
ncbi:unnamed protein product [Hydatigera taeniaeformis]|uniref:Uncharacterized protein n=1 Tax=Hydatigena taeniaeformis TaxID=6205 RepID=A0A0R3WR22_HYDTA|nr:unnamed protein product [Hydatigera taeniaeformis]